MTSGEAHAYLQVDPDRYPRLGGEPRQVDAAVVRRAVAASRLLIVQGRPGGVSGMAARPGFLAGWSLAGVLRRAVDLAEGPTSLATARWRERPGITDPAITVYDGAGGTIWTRRWEEPEALVTGPLATGRRGELRGRRVQQARGRAALERGNLDLRSERPKRSLWQRIVDLALTDARTLDGGIDEVSVERLERTLLESDFGVEATMELVAELERASERGRVGSESDLRSLLGDRIRRMLESNGSDAVELERPAAGPGIALILGVNGTGKTTTAGKLAWRFAQQGEKVLLAATDTFRAGAQEQLRQWAGRVGADYVGGHEGGDPAAVAFDAVEAALGRGVDRLLVDTAGRLHTQRNLMEELKKIDRVIGRLQPGAPQERILVVDATSGQNVISQAAEFGEALDLTGLVVAKFDSSARAGTIVSVTRELALPVRYLGTGERPNDLELFRSDRYLAKIFA